jgi:hypothetical protein
LTSINLENNKLGPEGAKMLAPAIRDSPSVTECNLRGNNLNQESAKELAKIGTEKRVTLFGIHHGQTEADFRDQGIGYVDAILIANDLAVTASLTSVNVLMNRLDTEAASVLLKVKEEKPMLRTLCGLTHAETELDYSDEGLRPADVMLLAPEISVMASLTYLWYNLRTQTSKLLLEDGAVLLRAGGLSVSGRHVDAC